MLDQTINEELMNAIERHDVQAVQVCLNNRADPNYLRKTWAEKPDGRHQPTTPLRLVMFCISDNLLEDDDLKQHAEIAKLLLRHGADPKPAMQLAELRYGKYDPTLASSPFLDVWHIVAGTKQ